MQTIMLDGRNYADARALHQALQRLLHLPAYYGCNADALFDCLTSRREQVNLIILHPGSGSTADVLHKCALAIQDAGGTIKKQPA